jgi:negative regulator of replication initiation
MSSTKNKETEKIEDTKMLGGNVPESIYWDFKKKATERKETMAEAIYNAAMLYIELKEDKKEDVV